MDFRRFLQATRQYKLVVVLVALAGIGLGIAYSVLSPPMLTIILLLSLFITLALGFYVLVAAPHHAINRAFAFFNSLMIVWIVKDIAFWCFHSADTNGEWWAMSSFIIGIALQYALLIFADVFPENGQVRWRRVGLYALPLFGSSKVIVRRTASIKFRWPSSWFSQVGAVESSKSAM